MIRVKMNDTVRYVKEICGKAVFKQISFYIDEIFYIAQFETSEKVKELLDQACELGFINFDKEKVRWTFKPIKL